MKRILAVLVENRLGVLARVSGTIRRRGFNIESLAVGTTADEAISRITLVLDGDEAQIAQMTRQLEKLIEVLEISDLEIHASVTRELALIKVAATPATRPHILQVASVFRANIVDVGSGSVTIEVTGDHEKVEALITVAHEYGIQELVRTGIVALARGTALSSTNLEEENYDTYVLRG